MTRSDLKKILTELTEYLRGTHDLDIGELCRHGEARVVWSSLEDKEQIYAYVRLRVADGRGRLEVGVTRGSRSSREARAALKAQVAERLDELDQASHHLSLTLSQSRYEFMATLKVNLERPKAAWRKAAALIKLCDELERAVARTLGA